MEEDYLVCGLGEERVCVGEWYHTEWGEVAGCWGEGLVRAWGLLDLVVV